MSTQRETRPDPGKGLGGVTGAPPHVNPAQEMAQVVRDAVAAELREGMREQRRPARLYAGAGAAGFYGGAAMVAGAVLALGLVLPMWASALIVAAVLLGAAVMLHGAARPRPGAETADRAHRSADAVFRARPGKGAGAGAGGLDVAPGAEPGAATSAVTSVPGAPPVPGNAPEVGRK
ncbi:phage holin family protein [Streptomyces sp. NPDC058657]|uniref:phage holin family protein n=1 Tax=unclassified Streptomyces TaxID=2593676 RepID=UPI003655FE38